MKKKIFNVRYFSLYRRNIKTKAYQKLRITPLTIMSHTDSKNTVSENKTFKNALNSLDYHLKNLKEEEGSCCDSTNELLCDISEIFVKIAESFKPEIVEFLNRQPQTCRILTLIKHFESVYPEKTKYNKKIFDYYNCPN